MKNPAHQFQLAEAMAKLAAGTLSPEETATLAATLRSDPAAHAYAARLLHLEGHLKASAPSLKSLLTGEKNAPAKRSPLRIFARSRVIPWSLATAAALALTLFLIFEKAPEPEIATAPLPQPVATLTEAKNCRWAQSSLPTVPGSRIGPGYYELTEGLATFTFESGAVLTLEAPSTLEITDAMHCHLRKGALIADVPESAIGFTVDTPDATVVDFGTKFGVSANDDGYYVVQVLEGLVEVTDKKKQYTRPLTIGQRVSVGGQNIADHLSESQNLARAPQPDLDDGWQRISTAYGKGADTFIQRGGFASPASALREFGNDPMLRVKLSNGDPNTSRKAYTRFDLSALDLTNIEDAAFQLTIVPGEIGFTSLCPDATFSVYGLTDESEDDWSETGRTWQSAPAHLSSSSIYHQPDPTRSRKLGEFTISQGITSGSVSIAGKDLIDFLKSDTNGLATLIICRDTDETNKGGYVHEFATKESRIAAPPALRILYGK